MVILGDRGLGGGGWGWGWVQVNCTNRPSRIVKDRQCSGDRASLALPHSGSQWIINTL